MGKITIQPIARDAANYEGRGDGKAQLQVNGNFMEVTVSPQNPDKKLIEAFIYQRRAHTPNPILVNLDNQDVEIALYWKRDEEPLSLKDMKVSVIHPDLLDIVAMQPGNADEPFLTVYVRSYKLKSTSLYSALYNDPLANSEYLEGYAIPFHQYFPMIVLPGSVHYSLLSYGDSMESLENVTQKRPICDVDRNPAEVAYSR